MFTAIDISSEVKQLLDNLFSITAKQNNVAKKEIALIFQLKNRSEFKCTSNEKPVNIKDAGTKAKVFFLTINKSITQGLTRLANNNSIQLSQVNVLIKVGEENNFVLILRNGNDAVKQIELDEFLNF